MEFEVDISILDLLNIVLAGTAGYAVFKVASDFIDVTNEIIGKRLEEIKAVRVIRKILIAQYSSKKYEIMINKTHYVLNEKDLSQIYDSLDARQKLIKYDVRIKYLSFINPLIKSLYNLKEDNEKHNSVIESVIFERIRKDNKAYVYLLSSLVIVIFLKINISYTFIPLLLMSLLFLNQQIISYRIGNGWYGKNYYEAKEILRYINSHFNKDDYFDGGGLKNIFPEIKIKESIETTEILAGNRV